MARDLYIDEDDNRFVQGPKNSGSLSIGEFFNGDDEEINIRWMRKTGIAGAPYRFVDKSSASLKVGLGQVRAPLTGGTWTITFGANTTTALPYNATAAQVQTALNLLASIIAEGSVTVTKAANAPTYQVTFGNTDAQALMTVDDTELLPLTSASTVERIPGDGSDHEVQVISLYVSPVVSQATWTDLATTVTATVTTPTGGSDSASEVQKIAWSVAPAGGTFAITLPSDTRSVTAAVVGGVFTTTTAHGFAVNQPVVGTGFTNEFDWTEGTTYYVAAVPSPTTFTIAASAGGSAISTATADAGTGTITTPARTTAEISATASFTDIATALQAINTIGSGNVTVTGIIGEYLLLSFTGEKANANLPEVTVSTGNLTPAYGKTGTFNLATFGLQDLFDATTDESISLRFEVQKTEGGRVKTTAQSFEATEDICKGPTGSTASLPGVSRYGTAAISNGATSVAVTFSTAFPATPTCIPGLTVEVPSGEGMVHAVLRKDSPTASGFTADLSGPTDSANYVLHYHAIA